MATVNASIKGQPLVTATIKQAASLAATLKPAVTLTSSITATGPQGPAGATGAQGPAGQGVPTGGTTGQILKKASNTNFDTEWGAAAGVGDVVGPSSATDNAIVRFDTTTGKLIQNSTVTVSDTGDVGAASLALTTDLPVTEGGTGASTASAARTNLGVPNIAGDTFTGDISVPDEVYGAGWNGSTEVPTKNAVYDKIETISAGGGVSEPLAIAYAIAL